MTTATEASGRAASLAESALKLVDEGRKEDGFRALREAAALAPDNATVRAAVSQLQRDDSAQSLPALCRAFVDAPPNDTHGERLLRFLRDASGEADIPSAVGQDSMALLLGRCGNKGNIGDKVVSTLLQRSAGARSYLASQLEAATTDLIFKQLWDTGEMTTHELATLLLDLPVWPSDEARYRCERDVFMLLLAKSMEAGMDQPGRVLEQLGRLLAADTERLHPILDADSLSGILSCLDVRRPAELRRQATVVTARYLAAAKETGQQLLAGFIASRVAVPTNDNLVIAFSAATVVFPLAPGVTTRLFLADGFAPSLLTLLVKKAKATRIRQTALDMLSAACADAASRETIVKYFAGWVEEQMVSGPEAVVGAAAVILAKLDVADASRATTTTAAAAAEHRGNDSKAEGTLGQRDTAVVVAKLKDLLRSSDAGSRQRAVEGLAYTSLQPAVKQNLAGDAAFLRRLAETIQTSSAAGEPALLFGALSVLANLTRYLPNLSDEQKRMLQLKAYADTSTAKLEPDPAERDDAVTQRCAAVLQAGVVPVLAPLAGKLSPPALALALSVVLALAREPKHRGSLAQQGAVRLLLQGYARASGAAASDREARFVVAHALARILISLDPNLLFAGSAAAVVLPISSAVAPLVSLLFFAVDGDGDSLGTAAGVLPSSAPPASAASAASGDQRDLLPTFEALMALTNLASTPDDGVRALIVRKAWVAIEDLLLSHKTLIQRATVELICNLMLSDQCVAKFVAIPSGGSNSSGGGGVNKSGNASVAPAAAVANTHGKGDGSNEDQQETAAGDEAESAAQAARCHNRLRILLALADADDVATRRAAVGALGMLTESEDPLASARVAALLRHGTAVPLILRLCQDEDGGVVLRAAACLRSIAMHTGSLNPVVDDHHEAQGNGNGKGSSSRSAASATTSTIRTAEAPSTADGAQAADGNSKNLAHATGSTVSTSGGSEAAGTAQELVKRHGGIDVLQKILLRSKDENVVSLALDALEALISAKES